MQYRQLGRTGTRVSAMCLGTMSFGGRTDEPTSVKMVYEAIDMGINLIDTANVYGRGVSEEITGKALAESGRRDEVVLATKAVARMGDGPNDHGASRYHLTRACEASLQRLQTDRIDLYQLHVVDLTTPMDEILGSLDTLVRQGKILYIGTSKWPVTLIMEALALSEGCGLPRMVSEQPPYNILDRAIENDLVWTCIRHGIGIISWGPLAYGILSGQYSKGDTQPAGSRYEKAKPGDTRFTPAALDAVDRLRPIAEARGITLAQLAHAWLLTRPGLTAPIIGPRTLEHLRDTVAACEVELTTDELDQIDDIVPPGRWASDFYDGNVQGRLRSAIASGEVAQP